MSKRETIEAFVFAIQQNLYHENDVFTGILATKEEWKNFVQEYIEDLE